MMKSFIRFIKRIFGVYETGYEYWVRLDEIKVPTSYKRTKVGKKKWEHKKWYWRKTGEFESKILIDRDFNLVDGFSSVKLAYVNGIDKVPVYFVD